MICLCTLVEIHTNRKPGKKSMKNNNTEQQQQQTKNKTKQSAVLFVNKVFIPDLLSIPKQY